MRTAISCGILLVLAMSGCHKNRLVPTDYIQYVQNEGNGLKKTVALENWKYTVQYKPVDYMIVMETKGKATRDYAKKRSATLRRSAWFNISFKAGNGDVSPLRYGLSSRQEYEHRYNYLLNEAAKDIKLVYGTGDTLQPMSYLFENNFNLTPQETIVVGFELPEGNDYPDRDMQLCYNDKLFNNGIIKVRFAKDALNNLPNLIF